MDKNAKEKQAEINPLLFKLAVPLALSLAGIIISTLTTKFRARKKPRGGQDQMDYPDSDSMSQYEFEEEEEEEEEEYDDDKEEEEDGDDDQDEEVEEEDVQDEVEEEDEEEKEGSDDEEEEEEEGGDNEEKPQTNIHLLESAREISIQQCHEESNFNEQIEGVSCLVASLEDRQSMLEAQFYDYCNIKEQESAFQKLQIMCLGLKLESLESQNQRLEDTIADFKGNMGQVDLMRAEIKLLQRKGKKLIRANRECSNLIHQYAPKLQAAEEMSRSNKEFHRTTKDIKEVADQLYKEIKAIEEKLDRSASKQKIEEGLVEDITILENEKLFEQLQHLRDQWSADMEELIYLGWINACLRRETFIIHEEEDDDRDAEEKTKPVQVGDEVVMELPHDERVGNCSIEFCDTKYPSMVEDIEDVCTSIVAKSRGKSLKKPRLLHKLKGWATGKGSCKKACGKGRSLG